jgi:hypothetical protein
MQELALLVLILVALVVAAVRYGVDSRDGFEWSSAWPRRSSLSTEGQRCPSCPPER